MKRRLGIILAILLLSEFLFASVKVNNIYYELDDVNRTAFVTNPDVEGEYAGNIVIPASILYNDIEYAVTGIGTGNGQSATMLGFTNCTNLSEITIPNSVKLIGTGAFYGCTGLTKVNISEGVETIGYRAFYGCSQLTEVTIPNSVTKLWGGIFEDCTGLTKVTFPENVDGTTNDGISNYLFRNCSSLTEVSLPNGFKILRNTFDGCSNLKNVTIPNSVTSIESNVFRGCIGLTSITIPNSVTSIGSSAFSGCTGLTSVTIPNSVTSIEGYAFSGCTGLTSVTIPNSVTSIGTTAFRDCSALTNADINSQSALDVISFTNKLTSIKLGDKITSIGNSKFQNCANLTSVTIPNSVTSIGSSAFSGCTGLTIITIPNSVTSIGNSAFYGCTGLKEVINKSELNITKGYTTNGYVAYYADIVYNGDKTVIGDFIFSDHTLVKYTGNGGDIALPENFNGDNYAIGEDVFAGNSNLTSVTIPSSVTSIGSSAFSGCTGLTIITIPNSVTSIGNSAFYGCTGLKEVINKSELNITKGYTTNGYVAYYADIVYNGDKTVIGDFIFSDHTLVKYTGNGGDIALPENFNGDNYAIGEDVFAGNSNLTSVTIPSSVTSIGSSAFSGCTGLTSITIPNSVTSIGASAFSGCSGLTEIICEGETPAGSNTIFGEGGEAGKIYVKALLKVPSQWFKLYKVTEPWCRFDMTASDFDMVVIPYENKAVFTWTPITGAEAYELTVIEKETGEALCSLNFDAYGRLRGLVLRNDSEKTYVGGYDFTVTSLRGDVEYDYTMEVKDISDNVIESMSGTFRTSGDATTAAPEAEESIVETARYDINGRKLNAPTKGVNIVKYSDGSFEKEFVR